jgi:mRNA interferase MazF
VVAFITSRVPVPLEASDILIDEGDGDFIATGLKVTSTVRLHRMVTLSADIFVRGSVV